MVIFLINQCSILPCSTFFSTFIFHPFSSKVYISRSKEIKKSKKIFSNHFDNPSFLPIPRSRLFDQFQNPLPPKYLSNILSPRARWNEKKGNEEIKGEGKKKCTNEGLTTDKIRVGRIFGGKSFYVRPRLDRTAFRFPDFSPSVAVGARFFSLWVERATRYKLVHASYEAVLHSARRLGWSRVKYRGPLLAARNCGLINAD